MMPNAFRKLGLQYGVAGIVVFGALLQSPCRADLLQKFRDEYAGAWEKLDAAYSHVAIETVETRHKKNEESRCSCSYLREGDFVRRVQTVLDGANNVDIDAFGGNPDKFFRIVKPRGTNHFTFLQFGPMSKNDFDLYVLAPCVCLYGPCYVESVSMRDYMLHNQLISAIETEIDGQKVVQIEVASKSYNHPVVNEVYFLPGSWALVGWTCHMLFGNDRFDQPHTVSEFRVDYVDGDPLRLKSIRRWMTSSKSPHEDVDDYLIEVKSQKFGPIPIEQFSCAALGVAEPTKHKNQTVWIIIVLGVLSLVAAVWFRSRKPKKESVTTTV